MTARGDANDIETLRRILATSRVIAVVGLSAEWYRPSFFAAKYMQAHGYRIVPVNPRYPSILGEICYPALHAIPSAIARTVDIVDCFRRTADILPIAEQAVANLQQIRTEAAAAGVTIEIDEGILTEGTI
mgnify:CR=1 FL=1